MAGGKRSDGGASGVPSAYDGRLDLDHLDLVSSELDVIGEDAPRAGERLGTWLEDRGVTPFVRRHRLALGTVTALTVVALAVAGSWWSNRPEPLSPEPHVFARASGADPTADVVLDVATGSVVGVEQRVLLSSAERPGVSLDLLDIVGPGLRAPGPGAPVAVDLARTDRPVTVSAALDCTDPATTTAVSGAVGTDYRLDLQRTSPSGEVRVDRIPLVGAATLATVVRRACLQTALDRDLTVTGLRASPVPGQVAADLDLIVVNASTRSWSGLRVSAEAQPVLVTTGASAQLEPGGTGHLVARYRPGDCADPVGQLAAGLPVRADVGPSGVPPADAQPVPSVLLHLSRAELAHLRTALEPSCGPYRPTATVTQAVILGGGSAASAGVVDLTVDLRLSGARQVDLGALAVSGVNGELYSLQTSLPLADGHATVHIRWDAPPCPDGGLAPPEAHVVAVGDLRRPYVLSLTGDMLDPTLRAMCPAAPAS